jgi:uncharacterized protein YbbC (DUF1343 family)
MLAGWASFGMLPLLAAPPARAIVGAEALVDSGYAALRGYARVGVIANPTSVLPTTAEHIIDRMVADRRLVNISCVFGPEHGFRGDQQDGKGGRSYVDNRTALPVYNSYGVSGQSLAALVAESKVDVIVFDIQDVGARYYTFVWTLFDFMVACATLRPGFPIVVLDRPNPIGPALRGPILKPGYESFVGRAAGMPTTHGMTVGELAGLFSGEYVRARAGNATVNVTTVPLQRWRRSDRFETLNISWVLPSPNMPTLETARTYPGTCMLEGTTLSEGRGTTRPFNIVGAPYLDWNFAALLRQRTATHAGFLLREVFFIPTFSKHVGNLSAGVDVLVTEPLLFDPIRVGIEVLVAARRYKGFAWLASDIDRLTGSNWTRLAIDRGVGTEEILAEYQRDLERSGFAKTRARYLLPEYAD